jgi:hypothetical protein
MTLRDKAHKSCKKCGARSSWHPVKHLNDTSLGLSTCVDVEIAPLVQACWDAGIVTTESCQDWLEEGPTWPRPPGHEAPECFLSFDGLTSYLRFGISVLSGGPENDLYHSILDGPGSGGWDWTCAPVAPHVVGDTTILDIFCCVVFPRKDLEGAIERCQKAAHLENREIKEMLLNP